MSRNQSILDNIKGTISNITGMAYDLSSAGRKATGAIDTVMTHTANWANSTMDLVAYEAALETAIVRARVSLATELTPEELKEFRATRRLPKRLAEEEQRRIEAAKATVNQSDYTDEDL